MILGKWFDPDYNLMDHYKIRYHMVALEQKLKTWRGNDSENPQTSLMAKMMWATQNIKVCVHTKYVHINQYIITELVNIMGYTYCFMGRCSLSISTDIRGFS
ncbi:MAG: hypothetical protein GY714_23265 [Desulfobacterales bacterium]|nr:hypothetical protein [Desulfobacterales bacterium]